MLASKHLPKIVILLTILSLLFCVFIVYAANAFDTTKITEYQKRMFGEEIVSIEIQADPADWQNLMDNALLKPWISADIIINGERFSAVGIRTKGNSSLTMVRNNRYSLQIKMNKYVKGQTYYGLDTFCINSMTADATYMKDYLSYEIMNFIGVATPLINYATVKVNDADYGFLLVLERYDQAFLDRVYSTSAGQLYNVKIQMGMRGNFEDNWQDVANSFPGGQQRRTEGAGVPERRQGNVDGLPDRAQRGSGVVPPGENTGTGGFPEMPEGFDFGNMRPGDANFPEMPGETRGFTDRGGMGMGGFGRDSGGSLIYTDDHISSYPAIFDNAVFSKITDTDKQRVVTALKNLNTGSDLERYFDVDGILRYFAAHTVVVNLDSYISNMQQNYYIYELDGRLTILPWDYNLAFGGFQSGNVSTVVNFPIDTPVSGVSMEDRPLLYKLLEVDEYRTGYYGYLQQIVEDYFESGLYESSIHALDAKINEYVKDDSSAFFTHTQYEESLPHLIALGYRNPLKILTLVLQHSLRGIMTRIFRARVFMR